MANAMLAVNFVPNKFDRVRLSRIEWIPVHD